MKDIVLQFSTTRGIVPAIIRARTNSKYSHVDGQVIYAINQGRLLGSQLFLDTAKSGVRMRDPDYAKFTKITKVTINVTDEQFAFYWTFLTKQLGKPYDLTAVFGLATSHHWREQDSWFCSELFAAALEYSGIITRIGNELNWITPQDLFEIVCASSVYVKTDEINVAA